MKNISNLILKVLLKSIIFPIIIIIINYHFIQSWKFYFEKQEPFILFFHMRSYTSRTITLFMVITIIYYINAHYDEIKLLVKNEFEYFLGVVYGVLKFVFIICAIPIIYMVAYSILKGFDSFDLVIEFFKMLLYEWILPISAVGIMTGFISMYLKNKILKYALSAAVFYFTSSYVLRYSIGSSNVMNQTFTRYISLFSDMAYAKPSYCFGVVYDLSYILDKSACVIIILFCILLAYIISSYKNKKRFLLSLTTVLVCVSMVFVITFKISNLVVYADQDIQYNQIQEESNYRIKSYNMDLDFKSSLNNNVSIELEKLRGENIKFYLDDIFEIEDIKINDKKADYTQKNNILTVFCNENDKYLKVDIKYKGFVHITTTWYKYMYIANSQKIMLPKNSIAWYPKPTNNDSINFTLNIASKNKVYCNLNLVKDEEKSRVKKYEYKGRAEDLFVYSGFYNEKTIDDVKYIWPQDLSLKNELDIQGGKLNKIKKKSKENIKIIIFGRTSDYNLDEIDNGILCLPLE